MGLPTNAICIVRFATMDENTEIGRGLGYEMGKYGFLVYRLAFVAAILYSPKE